MSGLQRSEVSFRRQGSSGFVWNDRFLSEELNKVNQNHHKDKDQEHQHQDQDDNGNKIEKLHAPSPPPPDSINSNNGGHGYRTGKVTPSAEPPSPKLSACGFCGAFGKTENRGQGLANGPGKHRSR